MGSLAPPYSSTTQKVSPLKLLDLPLELRNEIYALLFVQADPIACFRIWFTTAPRHLRRLAKKNAPDCCGMNHGCTHYDMRLRPRTGILRACRQVSEEALESLYKWNVFCVDIERTSRFLKLFTIGQQNLSRILQLRLTAWTSYFSYCIARPGERQWEFFRAAALEPRQWAALLEGLQMLEFVLKAAIWGFHGWWPVWVKELEKVLSFVGENVDAEMDAVDRCFKKSFRRVRTKDGDAYYYKTRFDPENITAPVASDEG
ncbi:hypothetical protein F4804DRAFT_348285 [Jackrogersella minutella]|nr:hypothetical protein F4804DRAFT_348285 [Jackrogersella minutella]